MNWDTCLQQFKTNLKLNRLKIGTMSQITPFYDIVINQNLDKCSLTSSDVGGVGRLAMVGATFIEFCLDLMFFLFFMESTPTSFRTVAHKTGR